MEFNEETARRIISEWGLSESTMRVWKTRGTIPEKYLNSIPVEKRKPETDAELKEYERGIRAFRSEKLNTAYLFSSSLNLPSRLTHHDWIRGTSTMSYPDFITVKKELNRLRIKIKSVVEKHAGKEKFTPAEKKEVDSVLESPLFKLAPLLGYDRKTHSSEAKESKVYKRVGARKMGRAEVFFDWEVTYILDRLAIFLLETSI